MYNMPFLSILNYLIEVKFALTARYSLSNVLRLYLNVLPNGINLYYNKYDDRNNFSKKEKTKNYTSLCMLLYNIIYMHG